MWWVLGSRALSADDGASALRERKRIEAAWCRWSVSNCPGIGCRHLHLAPTAQGEDDRWRRVMLGRARIQDLRPWLPCYAPSALNSCLPDRVGVGFWVLGRRMPPAGRWRRRAMGNARSPIQGSEILFVPGNPGPHSPSRFEQPFDRSQAHGGCTIGC